MLYLNCAIQNNILAARLSKWPHSNAANIVLLVRLVAILALQKNIRAASLPAVHVTHSNDTVRRYSTDYVLAGCGLGSLNRRGNGDGSGGAQ